MKQIKKEIIYATLFFTMKNTHISRIHGFLLAVKSTALGTF